MLGAYIRVSTDKQARNGVSIDMQGEMIAKHALMLELIKSKNEIEFYIDDGYSGSSLQRPAMTRLIADIKSGRINILFSYDLSRISRDIFDSSIFLNMIEKYNVVFKCLYDEAKMKSAGDRFNTNMKLVYNQYEREKIVEKTNDGLKSIADKGRYPIGGKVLFGYARSADKNICLHKTDSIIVKEMFRMGKERYSLQQIADYASSKQKKRKFYTYQVQQMFNDERYAGILIYKDVKYINIIPPIISIKDQCDAAQFYRKQKFKQNPEYYFDDLIFCVCGSKMSCTCAHGRSQKYYYYLCSHCNATISQNALEEYISVVAPHGSEENKLKKELAKESYMMNRKLRRLREKYFNGQLTDREYSSLAIAVEDRIETINFKKSGLKMKKKKIQYMDLTSKEDKKEFIQTTFKKMTVDPIKKIVVNVDQQ